MDTSNTDISEGLITMMFTWIFTSILAICGFFCLVILYKFCKKHGRDLFETCFEFQREIRGL